MRIVHISDIHLSKDNFAEFENNYRRALIKTLQQENEIKKIDVIVITGDLVNQGGHSLLKIDKYKNCVDPYHVFEQEFLLPLQQKLDFPNSKFLFIPGNHDINENEILWVDEKRMQDLEVDGNINDILPENRSEFNSNNKRIELFKNFEKRFHSETANYKPSNNESTYIYESPEGLKVGFALINDSWRCSTCQIVKHKDKKLFFGTQQLYDSLNIIEASDTIFNVLLTHHPLKSYGEEDEVLKIFVNREFHLHLFGDQHKHEYASYLTPNGSCFGIMARAALNKPLELESKWQPGFHVVDVDFYNANIEKIIYYKYFYGRCDFDKDTELAKDGFDNQKHKLSFKPVEKIVKVSKVNLDKSKYFRS